tara:strand:- start:468 stop:638 length:171 start_codon:yes stop_codon:yes gene_type:complete
VEVELEQEEHILRELEDQVEVVVALKYKVYKLHKQEQLTLVVAEEVGVIVLQHLHL